MEIITITDKAKVEIAKLCKETVVTEYDMILNYPRIIDHMVNYEKINDQQLVKDIDKLGKDSLGHFSKMDLIIQNLGGEMAWLPSTLPRLVGVHDELEKQLKKEEAARDLYKEARQIARKNKITVKVGGFLDRLMGKDISGQNFVSFEQIINDLDRLISDEERHIRVVKDSMATCSALKGK
ncbi:hypothetical protein ACFLVG_01415 [Chloroflexota bacterium]